VAQHQCLGDAPVNGVHTGFSGANEFQKPFLKELALRLIQQQCCKLVVLAEVQWAVS